MNQTDNFLIHLEQKIIILIYTYVFIFLWCTALVLLLNPINSLPNRLLSRCGNTFLTILKKVWRPTFLDKAVCFKHSVNNCIWTFVYFNRNGLSKIRGALKIGQIKIFHYSINSWTTMTVKPSEYLSTIMSVLIHARAYSKKIGIIFVRLKVAKVPRWLRNSRALHRNALRTCEFWTLRKKTFSGNSFSLKLTCPNPAPRKHPEKRQLFH